MSKLIMFDFRCMYCNIRFEKLSSHNKIEDCIKCGAPSEQEASGCSFKMTGKGASNIKHAENVI